MGRCATSVRRRYRANDCERRTNIVRGESTGTGSWRRRYLTLPNATYLPATVGFGSGASLRFASVSVASVGTTIENDGGEEARRRRRGEARQGENSRNGGEPNIGKCRRATGHVRTVDERDRGGDRIDERARDASRRGHGERYFGAGRTGRSRSRCAGFSTRGLHHRRVQLDPWHDLQRHHLGSATGTPVTSG